MDYTNKIEELEKDVDSDIAKGNAFDPIPCHISWDEVKYLNILQGCQSVDLKLGLREYSKLVFLFKDPAFLNMFETVFSVLHSGHDVPHDVLEVLDTPTEDEEYEVEPIASDSNPAVQEMAATGEGEDKVIVLLPKMVVDIMDELQGGERTDPTLGLQGFFSWGNALKSVVRVGATAVGAWFGGPLGAAAGNMAGRAITGQKFGSDMLMGGVKNGAYAYLGGMGASALGAKGLAHMGQFSTMPGLAGLGGGAAGSGAGGGVASKLPGVGGSVPGVGGAGGAGAGGAGGGGGSGLSSMIPGMGGNLMSYALPGALLGGSFLMGQKGKEKKDAEEMRRYNERQGRIDEMNRGASGKYKTPYTIETSPHAYDLDDVFERSRCDDERRRSHYKTGGQITGIEIKGKGNGQSDDIPRNAKENSWVWDATTVSHLGDGTTNAGQKAIEGFEKFIRKQHLPVVKDVIKKQIKEKPLRTVPCALSNGERVTSPELVAAVGKGSFKEGSHILRDITKEIRLHKISNHDKLPPSAHDVITYYKKVIGRR